jgi:hypothetical protein
MDLVQKGEKSDYPSGKRLESKGFFPAWPSSFITGVPAIKILDSLAVTW